MTAINEGFKMGWGFISMLMMPLALSYALCFTVHTLFGGHNIPFIWSFLCWPCYRVKLFALTHTINKPPW
jgi:hypothetical protein